MSKIYSIRVSETLSKADLIILSNEKPKEFKKLAEALSTFNANLSNEWDSLAEFQAFLNDHGNFTALVVCFL
jgi:hypothetical protein